MPFIGVSSINSAFSTLALRYSFALGFFAVRMAFADLELSSKEVAFHFGMSLALR
jgi:hypothetical protein